MSTLCVVPMAYGPCCVDVAVLVFGESVGAWGSTPRAQEHPTRSPWPRCTTCTACLLFAIRTIHTRAPAFGSCTSSFNGMPLRHHALHPCCAQVLRTLFAFRARVYLRELSVYTAVFSKSHPCVLAYGTGDQNNLLRPFQSDSGEVQYVYDRSYGGREVQSRRLEVVGLGAKFGSFLRRRGL